MALRRRDVKLEQVHESDASGEVAEIYGRIKETLRANTVDDVWRVFATKSRFLAAVWDQLEPAVDQGFMEAAEGIRALAIERVRETAPVPDHRPLLGDNLARANEELRVFMEMNPRLLILTCALQRSWRGEEVGGIRGPAPAERGVPPWHPTVEVAEAGLFQGGLRAIYDEITEVLDLPEVSTEYKVLGKWPDYLQQAWADVRAFVRTDSWRGICATSDWVAEQVALALPAKINVSPEKAETLGLQSAEVDEVDGWIDTFHSMLPGLIVNDSYFWLGMLGGVERLSAPTPVADEAPAGRGASVYRGEGNQAGGSAGGS